MRPAFRFAFMLLASAFVAFDAKAADVQPLLFDPSPVAEHSPLSIGFYGGELYRSPFISIFYAPTKIDLQPSYLVAANLDYRFYKFTNLPLQFEGELNIAKRFGDGQDQVDISVAPFLRWTWFPWNNILYTTVRVGLMGRPTPPRFRNTSA